MRLDKRLNLVIPIERARDTLYVHSTPISAEIFKANFMVIARTSAAMWGLGLGPTAGPRVAAMMMEKVAKDLGLESETQGLFNEMRRLSNAIVPTEAGWETIPLHDAITKGLIDADDASEVDNAITFFTVTSWMQKRNETRAFLEEAAKLWGAQLESSTCTEFAASLKTSTVAASSGETVAVSQLPR